MAHGASKSFLTCVRAQMPLQLVGAGEALAAEQPVADERPLAGVPPEVRLQVARLPVHLAAPGYVAAVDVLLAQMDTGRAEPLRLLAVRAVAGRPAGVAALAARRRCLRGARWRRRRTSRVRTQPEPAHAHAHAHTDADAHADAPARLPDPDAARLQHALVAAVLQQMLAGAEQVRGVRERRVRQRRRVVVGGGGRRRRRVIRHRGRVHAGGGARADVEPAAGRPVHVPPAGPVSPVAAEPVPVRLADRVERVPIVRVAPVHRTELGGGCRGRRRRRARLAAVAATATATATTASATTAATSATSATTYTPTTTTCAPTYLAEGVLEAGSGVLPGDPDAPVKYRSLHDWAFGSRDRQTCGRFTYLDVRFAIGLIVDELPDDESRPSEDWSTELPPSPVPAPPAPRPPAPFPPTPASPSPDAPCVFDGECGPDEIGLFFHGWKPLPTAASASGGGDLLDNKVKAEHDNRDSMLALKAAGLPSQPPGAIGWDNKLGVHPPPVDDLATSQHVPEQIISPVQEDKNGSRVIGKL
uniref:Uncharacterized protein n=1 Tax=Anopheles farauti TaxID=69004 RepID=A0A182Q891_9DIPT